MASVAREPAHELDAVHVAFLLAVDQEPEAERVIEELAHAWEGRIEVQLLGPMAAYDFARTAQPKADTGLFMGFPPAWQVLLPVVRGSHHVRARAERVGHGLQRKAVQPWTTGQQTR